MSKLLPRIFPTMQSWLPLAPTASHARLPTMQSRMPPLSYSPAWSLPQNATTQVPSVGQPRMPCNAVRRLDSCRATPHDRPALLQDGSLNILVAENDGSSSPTAESRATFVVHGTTCTAEGPLQGV